jgi:GTP-binding protein
VKQIFIDHVKILVEAGKGGDGCRSFYRDRRSRFPKPDGGDGGKGGDIILKTDKNILSLVDLGYRKHFVAQKGRNGQGNDKKGEDGKDCIIPVPAGTLVKDTEKGFVLRDLTQIPQEVVVARGGPGGLGNRPHRDATRGAEGEKKKLSLELKLIADIGLIGYPNVGKSTLLNCLSSAKSKVAAYPFTTKTPILGRLDIEGGENIIVVADIPGLVEGAHKGKGLGHEFLRHIERTRILVHIVDISQSEGRDALSDYLNLNKELFLYNPALKEKPQIVVANKMDLPNFSENFKKFSEKLDRKIYPISALTGEGIEAFLEATKRLLVKNFPAENFYA